MHATLCDYIADIAQNSVEAGAKLVDVELATGGGSIRVKVRDDGKGMSPETLARAEDPFYTEPGKHSGRRVGLGLPFLREVADQTGGSMKVDTALGRGTTVSFSLPEGHWDTPPIGDIPSTVVSAMCYPGGDDGVEVIFRRSRGGRRYEISKTELAEALGDLETADSISLAKQFIQSQETELENGSTGE